jgi:hypothetical protein
LAHRLHEAQRRHVVVVGSHADNHAHAAVSARPRVHSLTYRRYLWHPLHLKRDIHGGAVKTERISVHHDPLRKTTCSRDRSDNSGSHRHARTRERSIHGQRHSITVLTTRCTKTILLSRYSCYRNSHTHLDPIIAAFTLYPVLSLRNHLPFVSPTQPQRPPSIYTRIHSSMLIDCCDSVPSERHGRYCSGAACKGGVISLFFFFPL